MLIEPAVLARARRGAWRTRDARPRLHAPSPPLSPARRAQRDHARVAQLRRGREQGVIELALCRYWQIGGAPAALLLHVRC